MTTWWFENKRKQTKFLVKSTSARKKVHLTTQKRNKTSRQRMKEKNNSQGIQ